MSWPRRSARPCRSRLGLVPSAWAGVRFTTPPRTRRPAVATSFRSLVAALVLAGLAAAAPAPKAVTPAQIKQAIESLASPRFAVREQASKLLWEAGRAAEADLRAAADSKDEETANRAKAILEKFDWGLYPDTPAEIVTLIGRF